MNSLLLVNVLSAIASVHAGNIIQNDIYEVVRQIQTENLQTQVELKALFQDMEALKSENADLKTEITFLKRNTGKFNNDLAHFIEETVADVLKREEDTEMAFISNNEKRFLIPTAGTTKRPLTSVKPTSAANIKTSKVAFSASLSKPVDGSLSDKQYTAIFNNLISNEGSAYSPTTGVFTAPEKGVYFFFSNIKSDDKYFDAIYFVHNNNTVCSWDKGTDIAGSSATVINLDVGDRVFVQHYIWSRDYSNYWQFASFSGFQI